MRDTPPARPAAARAAPSRAAPSRGAGDALTGESLTAEFLTGEFGTGELAVATAPARPVPRAAPRGAVAWPLLLAAVLETAAAMIGVLRVPPLVQAAGGGAADVGALGAAFALAQMGSAIGWGRLSDRVGRRAALLAGLAVSALGWTLLVSAGTMPALAGARVLLGIGSGTAGVLVAAVLDGAPPSARAPLLGRLGAATSFGAIVGPAMVIALARAPLPPEQVMAAITALAVPAAWRTLPRSARATSVGRERGGQGGRQLRTLLPLLVAIYAVAAGAASGVPTMLPVLLDASHAAWAVMALGAAGVVMRAALVAPLAARLGETRMLAAGLTCIAAALLLLCWPGSAPVVAAVVALAVGTALTFPALGALVARATPPSRRGAVMGAQQAAGGATRAAFPLALGAALDVGLDALPLAACAALLAIVAVAARGGGLRASGAVTAGWRVVPSSAASSGRTAA